MGVKSSEAIAFESIDDLIHHMRSQHSVYMQVEDQIYYLTDANDIYWRAQDTSKFNEKDHYVDCSQLVPIISEFIDLPFANGKSVRDMFEYATFYPSIKAEAEPAPEAE